MCPHGNDKWQLHIGIFPPDRVFRGLRTRYNFPLFARVSRLAAFQFFKLAALLSLSLSFQQPLGTNTQNYNSQLIISWPHTSIFY